MTFSKSAIFGLVVAAAAAAAPSAAFAHDFFLLPSQFTATAAGPLELQATVGSSFPRPEIVVGADRIAELYVRGPGEPRLSIAGAGANALRLNLSPARPGLHVAGVRALPRDVEYGEDRIGVILEEYRVGPQAVAAVERLARPRTLRVSSRRFAKTIVCSLRCDDGAAAATPLGVALEFVAVGAATDHFRLLHEGRAVANHPVDLVASDGARRHLMTDPQGKVHLPADVRGPIMLFAALMQLPAEGERFILNLSSLTLSR